MKRILNSWAGLRGKPFDDDQSLYNGTPSALARVRSALVKSQTQRVKIQVWGHSVAAGAFATIGSTDIGAQIFRVLTGEGAQAGGTGWVYADNNTGPTPARDVRWTSVGTWAAAGASDYPYHSVTGAGQGLVFQSNVAGTAVEIVTFDAGSPIAIYIDDNLMETYTPPLGAAAAATALVTRSFSGLANTQHKVEVRSTAATVHYFVKLRVRAAAGIEVTNAARGGTQASHWTPTAMAAPAANHYNSAMAGGTANGSGTTEVPDIVFLMLDGNEAISGTPVATYKANMQAIISALQTAGVAVVLMTGPPAWATTAPYNGYPQVTQALWESFLAAEYDLADQYDIPLLDVTHLMVSASVATARGWMQDQVHPNATGHGIVARTLAQATLKVQSYDERRDPMLTEWTNQSPTAPSAGSLLFTRYRARRMPAAMDPHGHDTVLQPAMFTNRITKVSAIPGVATVDLDSVTVTHLNNGTATPAAATIANTNFFTSRDRYAVATPATGNGAAGTRYNVLQYQLSATANNGGFHFVTRVGVQTATAGMRLFFGLWNQAATFPANAEPSTQTNFIGFIADSTDTNIQFASNDASGTATKTDLGANFPRNSGGTNFYEFSLYAPSAITNQVHWSARRLNDGALQYGVRTTDLPAAGTLLAPQDWISNGATLASAVLHIQLMYCEQDN